MGNNADIYFDDLLLPGKEMNLGLSKLAKNKVWLHTFNTRTEQFVRGLDTQA